MNADLIAALCILFMACVLTVWYGMTKTTEGFEGGLEGSMCGVGMASCAHPLRCMNGYCKSQNAPSLPPISEFNVEPSDPKDVGSFLHTE